MAHFCSYYTIMNKEYNFSLILGKYNFLQIVASCLYGSPVVVKKKFYTAAVKVRTQMLMLLLLITWCNIMTVLVIMMHTLLSSWHFDNKD